MIQKLDVFNEFRESSILGNHAMGAFDELMGGVASSHLKSKIFYNSAHYPHIEEQDEFIRYIKDILND